MYASLNTTIEITPSREQINTWIKKFVPEIDLFFISKKELVAFEDHLNEVLVIPRNEFFNHSSYKQIQFINSYLYWNISSQANFVIVAHASWINELPEQKKRELFAIQIKMGRGLIFPLTLFTDTVLIPKEYILREKTEEYVVIQHDMWNKLPYELKENSIKAYAQLWDKWFCNEIPEQTPLHISKYANQFSVVSGSNCLSATLFAITGQEWMINEWVHPETFVNALKRNHYSFINDDKIGTGDVVAWVNEDDVIQHASYHIGNNLFFNKEGQTFFNPWKVIHLDELKSEWGEYKVKVYRKWKANKNS